MEVAISHRNQNSTGPHVDGTASLIVGGMVRFDAQRRLVKQQEGLFYLLQKSFSIYSCNVPSPLQIECQNNLPLSPARTPPPSFPRRQEPPLRPHRRGHPAPATPASSRQRRRRKWARRVRCSGESGESQGTAVRRRWSTRRRMMRRPPSRPSVEKVGRPYPFPCRKYAICSAAMVLASRTSPSRMRRGMSSHGTGTSSMSSSSSAGSGSGRRSVAR